MCRLYDKSDTCGTPLTSGAVAWRPQGLPGCGFCTWISEVLPWVCGLCWAQCRLPPLWLLLETTAAHSRGRSMRPWLSWLNRASQDGVDHGRWPHEILKKCSLCGRWEERGEFWKIQARVGRNKVGAFQREWLGSSQVCKKTPFIYLTDMCWTPTVCQILHLRLVICNRELVTW